MKYVMLLLLLAVATAGSGCGPSPQTVLVDSGSDEAHPNLYQREGEENWYVGVRAIEYMDIRACNQCHAESGIAIIRKFSYHNSGYYRISFVDED